MPADDNSGDRTEEATQHRRQEARERGQVPKSRDLGAAISLIGAILLLRYGGHGVAWLFHSFTESILGVDGRMAASPTPDGMEVFSTILYALAWFALTTLPLLAGIFLLAAVANYGQVGFLFAPATLEIKLDKLNPVAGLKRMFSLRSLITLAMNVAKVALMFVVAWPVIRGEFDVVGQLVHLDTHEIYVYMVQAVLRLALYLACLLVILGVLDYAYQRYQHSQDLRMTKEQVRQEMRNLEGSPENLQRRRQMQRELSRQRMMQEVPKADVVIRNPTHFAVALRYEDGKPAPWVVAKGTDLMALRIIEVAEAHQVPVFEDRPLARKLYAALAVGDFIPADLFQVVAALIARARLLKDPRALRAAREAERAEREARDRAEAAARGYRAPPAVFPGAPWS